MADLGWTEGQARGASRGRLIDDLDELYRRTRAAQAEAERHGFAGLAAALAGMAATLALEPGPDSAKLRALAAHGATGGPDPDGSPDVAAERAGPGRAPPQAGPSGMRG